MTLSRSLEQLFKRKSVKYGIPFLLLVVGGSFGLKHFASLRFEYRKVTLITPEIAKELGIELKKPGTLESEYEKIKDMDIDNWKQVRGPRPWEQNEQS
ncbi:cytochrome c oxidase assembly protein COX16 homolog, mitochondrial [Cylas formicarius]|uniref:cytochrome c oxidase assembly protein COX16 homolog, mitochondrial n=1 Tax=Cylas formicarius TaxID=197179 RepID=UPI002958462A|nr:cytochrome c oxidase assembly protein COX16 homolog, mitochondrial [Cylas formicarius]